MTKVIITDNFRSLTLKYGAAARRGVDRASNKGVRAAQSRPSRYRLQSINAATRVVPARVIGTKIIGGFVNDDFRQIFFEHGTLMLRKKPLKQPRKRRVTRGGIEPQHTMFHAKKAAREALLADVAGEMRAVR